MREGTRAARTDDVPTDGAGESQMDWADTALETFLAGDGGADSWRGARQEDQVS